MKHNHIIKAGNLTEEQIKASADVMLQMIKDDAFPQIKFKDSDHYETLTQEEIDAACPSLYAETEELIR